MLIVGIDPGASGGITIIKGDIVSAHKMPDTEADVRDLLLSETFAPRFAFIEAVHSMPKQGVSSSFAFGRSYGFLRGIITGIGIPFEEVTPQKWQKALGCMSKGDKNVTKAAAQRLWPHIRWTHSTADSALIAEYGRRTLHERGML